MGGCRCIFRTCANSTANSSGMHFFRFPYKDRPRLQTWAKYADAENILKMDASKVRNKVVCAEHFRDECFMNYLKDRLVATAVPTLLKVSGSKLVKDFETGNDPTPIYIPPSKLAHLQPPGETFQTDPFDETEILEDFVIERIESHSPEPKAEPVVPVTISPEKRKVHSQSEPRLLNKRPRTSTTMQLQMDLEPSTSKTKKLPKLPKNLPPVEFVMNDDLDDPDLIESIEDLTSLDDNFEEINIDEQEDAPLSVNEDFLDIPATTETTTVSQELFHSVVEDYEKQIKALNEQIETQKQETDDVRKKAAEEAETLKNSLKTQVEAVSTSKTAPPTGSANPVPLTKAQLFNSIKKYLCPSVATLVRMEMFGGPERAWKPDERQLSVDMLRLGNNVFDYLRDEWRIRMPPKKNVLEWLTTNEVENEEDL